MGKTGPESRLIARMRKRGNDTYGERLVLTKYHGSQFGESGVSDLGGTLDGLALAIEVKHPKNYGGSVERALAEGPTVKQMAYLARFNKAGGYGCVVADMGGFEAALEEAAAIAKRRNWT